MNKAAVFNISDVPTEMRFKYKGVFEAPGKWVVITENDTLGARPVAVYIEKKAAENAVEKYHEVMRKYIPPCNFCEVNCGNENCYTNKGDEND